MDKQIEFIKSLNATELLQKYGSPIYVYSEELIRTNYQRLSTAIGNNFPKFKIFYAVKANNNPGIVSILNKEGSHADCSSNAEIYLAEQSGFKKEQILYTGNFQGSKELEYGLEHASQFNIDSLSVAKELLELGNPEVFCCRINPGITKGSFAANELAGPNAKFGLSKEDAIQAYKLAQEKGITRFGIHMMTGSNILDSDYFTEATDKLFSIVIEIFEETGIQFEFINTGGGYGTPYHPDENNLDIEATFRNIKSNWDKHQIDEKLNSPFLYTEPGRYLVGNSGVIIAKVDSIKESFGKTYIGTDCGLNTLIRPALYDAYHHIVVIDKEDQEPTDTYQIVGKICENSDFIAKDRKLPKINQDDTIAILNGGAYGFSMSSQYNSRPRCAEVLMTNDQDHLIRKPEEPKDLHLNVVIPDHLK